MSLRSRIVLVVAVVFAIVSAIAGWLMLSRTERSLVRAFDRAAQTRAGWLLSLVSPDPAIIPLPLNDEQMLVTVESYGSVRDLFRSPHFPTNVDINRQNRWVEPPSEPDRPISSWPGRLPRKWLSYRLTIAETTINQTPNSHIRLMLVVPADSLRQDIDSLRWTFGLGWLLSLVLALGAGYIAAGWLLHPIQRLVDQASHIGNATRIDPLALPKSRDELYGLTIALNQMLNRIRENMDTQRHFFGAAAHELRTPLAIMKTGLEVTLKRDTLPGSETAFLKGQLDEVSRLARLIDEFMTLSQAENGVPKVDKSPVSIVPLLERCLGQLASLALEYEVNVELHPKPLSTIYWQTDAGKLEHILLNLIENAIKYAVTGSTITVQVDASIDGTIRVQNKTTRRTGPTLDLMQPYFRADPLKEGHGLGLWISHRLTTLLGGRIDLSWQDFTFVGAVQIPLADSEPMAQSFN